MNILRVYRSHVNLDYKNMRESVFLNNFRIQKTVFMRILSEIEELIEVKSINSTAISASEKVLITLKFLGTNAIYRDVGDGVGVSKAAVCCHVKEICEIIADRYFTQEVCFPSNEGLEEAKQLFAQKGLPAVVIGAIDGTLVRISSPPAFEKSFVDRHNNKSINVSLICGPESIIYWASCNNPGSVGDSRVFKNSNLYKKLCEGNIFPENSVLLADSAYASAPFVITPFVVGNTHAEQLFLRAHRKGRVVVERTIGQLKSMFRVLQDKIRTRNPVHASMIHHNMLQQLDIFPPQVMEGNENQPGNDNENEQSDNSDDEVEDGFMNQQIFREKTDEIKRYFINFYEENN